MNVKVNTVVACLTKAGVPRNAWVLRSADLGMKLLADYAAAAKKKDEDRLFKTVAFVSGGDADKRVLAMEILAKELVIARLPVKYILYSQLRRLVRGCSTNDVIEPNFHGVGAIVVPDLPYENAVPEQQRAEYLETVGYLISHVYDGGVLALSGSFPRNKKVPPNAQWPLMVERIIKESGFFFEADNVNSGP